MLLIHVCLFVHFTIRLLSTGRTERCFYKKLVFTLTSMLEYVTTSQRQKATHGTQPAEDLGVVEQQKRKASHSEESSPKRVCADEK